MIRSTKGAKGEAVGGIERENQPFPLSLFRVFCRVQISLNLGVLMNKGSLALFSPRCTGQGGGAGCFGRVCGDYNGVGKGLCVSKRVGRLL